MPMINATTIMRTPLLSETSRGCKIVKTTLKRIGNVIPIQTELNNIGFHIQIILLYVIVGLSVASSEQKKRIAC